MSLTELPRELLTRITAPVTQAANEVRAVAQGAREVVEAGGRVVMAADNLMPTLTRTAEGAEKMIPAVSNVLRQGEQAMPHIVNTARQADQMMPALTNTVRQAEQMMPGAQRTLAEIERLLPTLEKTAQDLSRIRPQIGLAGRMMMVGGGAAVLGTMTGITASVASAAVYAHRNPEDRSPIWTGLAGGAAIGAAAGLTVGFLSRGIAPKVVGAVVGGSTAFFFQAPVLAAAAMGRTSNH